MLREAGWIERKANARGFIRTPWQPYLVAAYGVFVGEVAESFIIDSDHWRHYFLILGLVWGLSAATMTARMQARRAQFSDYPA